MSILLEGKVQFGTELPSYSGIWQFSKERKTNLKFQYNYVSDEIPRDLLDYVSFITDPNPAPPIITVASSNKNKNNRGRGRLKSSTKPITENAEETSTSVDANADNMQDESEMNKDDSGDMDIQDDTQDGTNADEGAGEQEPDKKDGNDSDAAKEKSQQEGTTSTSTSQTSIPREPLKIDRHHPLFGLWEGKFEVKSAEDTIPETFFFHSFIGFDPPADLIELPPEPNFSYTVLRVSEAVVQSLIPTYHYASASSANPENNPNILNIIAASETTTVAVPAAPLATTASDSVPTPSADETTEDKLDAIVDSTAEKAVSTDEKTKDSIPSNNGSAVESGSNIEIKQEEGSSVSTSANVVVDTASTTQDGSSTLSYPEWLKHCQGVGYVLLFGFGRNHLGRFSLVGSYHLATGAFRCEKKYLVTKGVRRPRRYSWENPATNSVQGGVGYGGYGTNNPTPRTSMTRLRNPPQQLSSYFNLDGGSQGANTEHGQGQGNAMPGQQGRYSVDNKTLMANNNKRKRSVSGNVMSKNNKEDSIMEDLLPTPKSFRPGTIGYYPSNLLATIYNNTIVPQGPNPTVPSANANSYGHSSHYGSGTKGYFRFVDLSCEDTESYRSAFLDDETGEIYEGGWFQGLRHGMGICLFPDGSLFEGQWNLGQEKAGRLMTGDRQLIFQGDWIDGLPHGSGTYYYPGGDRYTGDWKEGHRHGRGEYACASGCSYVGDWKENKRHGRGCFTWSDGSYYEGDWDHDTRHGRGVLVMANGFKYDGNWAHNLLEGRGTCTFPSGQEYQGTFKQGLREGRGSIRFPEGANYEGRFRDDRIDGQGTVKITDTVPGACEGERLIPIQIQADLKRIHWKAGFGDDAHH